MTWVPVDGVALQGPKGGTEAVAAGLDTFTFNPGAINNNFQITFTPSWNTAVILKIKSSTAVTVEFSAPAPSGGGSLDWFIWGIN